MRTRIRTLIALVVLILAGASRTLAQAPTITSISPSSGPVGSSVVITGTNFDVVQGSSTITLNGMNTPVVTWSSTSILAVVPSGATSGAFSVTVNGQAANSSSFTVAALASGWSDSDVGSVGLAGSASYANGTFTVKGAGASIWGTADGFNYAYQSLSGDGTIVARVVTVQGTTYAQAGVMIRETLNAGSTNAYMAYQNNQSPPFKFFNRTSTGGSTSATTISGSLPYWVKVVRSGSTFSGYVSADSVNWTQAGSSVTISMAQNVYIGLAVSGDTTSALATATFDSVSISSSTMSVPSITNISATTGTVGTQVGITGSNFGASEGNNLVMINGVPTTTVAWSGTAVIVAVPAGASSGLLTVFTGTSMNASNGYYFTVEPNPLPQGWLDQDVGAVGLQGSASFNNETFTITGAGVFNGTSVDAFHLVYLPLSGDGSITARVVTTSGGSYPGLVAIRETLSPGARAASMTYYPNQSYLSYRTTTNANYSSSTGSFSGSAPYWFKLVRSGNSFTGYMGSDGINWSSAGTVSVTMAQNAFIALGVASGSTTATATVTFDNVEVSSAVAPLPTITGLSATTGWIGSQVVISGTNFGSTQGSSVVTLNGAQVTVNSWTSNSISITIPSGASSGPLLVSVAPSMDDSNYMYFRVTPNPLPLGWLDQDIGQVSSPGSASYANGTFTITGSGSLGSSADALHFLYQPLSGDGTIIARFLGSGPGIMIRESLAANSAYACMWYYPYYASAYFGSRTSDGGSGSTTAGPVSVNSPSWLKLTRSGSTFSAYTSPDGVNWTELGSSVTLTMATNAYIGLAQWSGTGGFDNVSINSAAAPAPAITSLSATSGSIGTQITISGSNFGSSQGSSLVTLNSLPMTVNSWSTTSITITISAGAASGPMLVVVGPSMDESNYVNFTVTPNPLPSGWLDQDVGSTGATGNASYASGVFTVSGAGALGNTSDAFHFAYQSLSGDGTIVARFLNAGGGGVMIRETLTASSTYAYLTYYSYYASAYFSDRATTGGSSSTANPVSMTSPCWMKLTRSGTTFTGYVSPDGVYWTQVAQVTISMAQSVNIGLASASGTTGTLNAVSFDNVSIAAGSPTATPVVTGISPTSGTIGTSVTVSGSNFGATQGTSSVLFNGAAATSVTSWSSGQIVAAVPGNASSGPVTVVVNSTGSNKNYVFAFYNPVVSSLAPPAAQAGGSITLTGTGFGSTQGSSQVQFNGVNASISSWSNTSVVAVVPPNATSGPVTLIEGGITSNAVNFNVIEPISISGISPATGPIGTTVTISGAGFGATQSDSVASFYGAKATITSWSDTSIVVVVPAGAWTGPVSVQVAGITIYGPQYTLTSTTNLTDSLGNTSTYTSSLVGGMWVVTNSTGSGCSSCTQRGTISKTYDSEGNVLTDTNENGHTRTYTYDSKGNVLTLSEPDGNGNTLTTTYTYNSFNEVLTVTDPMGFVTTNTYDANGNLLTVTTPKPNSSTNASVTQFTYNSLGQMTQVTDPLNNVTKLTYTPAGLIYTITDAQTNVTTYGYDNFGNRTSVTDALNHQTTFTYDSMNRLTKITYPDSTTTQFGYDYRGRRTSLTDQNGKVTQYAYDDADRLTTVTDAANNVTTYGYDTESNLTSIKDANSNTTSFSYDAFGRVTKTTFPSGYVEQYAYDGVNNLTSKTDRKNQSITYTYDQLNRLTQKSYPDTSTVNYTYDLDSRLTQVTDPTGTYQFTFDNMGRLTSASTSYSFLTARNFTASYSYDAASNRTGFVDPENGSTAYVYDTLNRLQTLTPPSAISAGSFGFGYDALSRRTQLTRPNNITTNYSYDNLSHLLSVLHQSGSTVLDGASYTLDNAGNRTAKTNQQSGVTSNYTVDPLYELTKVTQAANTAESYTYDPVGNRLTSLAGSYSNNSSNEMTAAPNATYTYDYNGNTATKTDSTGTTSYTWDFENRLVRVALSNNGGTVSFKYDPLGRRIQKSFTSGANPPTTTTTNYAYDGDNLVEEVDPNGNMLARYEQTQNIDEPLAMLRSGVTSYYETDALGSVTSLSSPAGALVQTYTFDSFGKQTASSGSLTNPFRYTAREFDTETSLYYYRARYYDPSTGRFLSEDRPGATSDIHALYAYTLNNPLVWTDPKGLTQAPPGPPPVPVPGGGSGNGWKWNPDPGNPRGGTWGPQVPIPGQSQPQGSWDPKDGHWDVDDGKGGRGRYDPDGNPLTPEQAHPKTYCPPRSIPLPNITPLVTAIVVAVIVRIFFLIAVTP